MNPPKAAKDVNMCADYDAYFTELAISRPFF